MNSSLALAGLLLSAASLVAQSPAPAAVPPRPSFNAFDVATIRPANTDEKGRYLIMEGTHRFVGKYYTLDLLIAAAYNLNPRQISGGPSWADSDRFDILAVTSGACVREKQQVKPWIAVKIGRALRALSHRVYLPRVDVHCNETVILASAEKLVRLRAACMRSTLNPGASTARFLPSWTSPIALPA